MRLSIGCLESLVVPFTACKGGGVVEGAKEVKYGDKSCWNAPLCSTMCVKEVKQEDKSYWNPPLCLIETGFAAKKRYTFIAIYSRT
ncbi:hypothetical protein MKX03_014994 [Papaver bracteatum]|nr:hypothetical protein MKX03_014994 [Papaver bracteatum]